ncbi:phage major capsid protein [Paracoccus sediminis]|uniref:Phage major capsid protein n=1 Tax=Paracoccus sediminis TaxID=1214787 RepID=A0A238XL36_9RHOB|nr:phage major capsid protein [Paracoccus sediminis]TBN48568.1 phage major capsid protein [Paracoccus sediminis]SNR59173.1 phage major capsid protein, HK97 family [Paracoccus sediminis]
MLNSIKIARRQSEIRQQLSGLVGKDSPNDDETRSMETLDAEYRSNETRYRAALIAEDTERREAGAELETRSDREWADMLGRFELRQVALSLDEGKALSGATAEIVEELRSAGGYRGIPIPYAALETRAGETIAADQVNPKTIRPVIDRIFPNSVAERLGIQRINIGAGELAFPVATAGAIFGWQTNELANVGAAQPYETAERSLNPDHTGGAQMVISRKALKQAGEGLEAAIRRDMNAVIGTELDRVVINGSGANGQPLGIIPGAATYGIPVTPVGATATWAAFQAQIVAFMEANAITSANQVNLGFDPAIWAELDDALITGTAVSEWDRLTKHVGTPAISNVIPDETAIMTANVQGVAPGYLGLWGGVDLIRDPYTKAASGHLVLTALVTADFTVPRGLQTRILTGIGEP